MKKLTGLIGVLIVVGLSYTGFWFYQSQKVKDLVVSHLKYYEAADSDGYHIKVTDVTASGFPFGYEINLNQPKYQSAEDTNLPPAILVDGIIKVGTDVLGTTFWLKKEGDLKFNTLSDNQKLQQLVLKGNAEVKVEVLHPEYTKSLLEPLKNFPEEFFKEKFSWVEFFKQVKSITYTDNDFAIYANDQAELKKMMDFSSGFAEWKHNPSEDKEDISFNLSVRGLQASDQGKAISSYFSKQLNYSNDSDIAYLVGSGKNDIDLNFVAIIPKNFGQFDISNYKDSQIALKSLSLKNQYGSSDLNFDLKFSKKDEDSGLLHVNFDTHSFITKEGALAMHTQFINGLKQQINEDQNDPQSKLFSELLKCCEKQLNDIIPDYTKLGTIKFNLDSDLKVRNIQGVPNLEEITVNGINFITNPYSIKSSGNFDLRKDKVSGKYVFIWNNYKGMIHDIVSYFNRIHPVLAKIADSNGQKMSVGVLNQAQEQEIVDFFKSLSDNHDSDHKDITITVDYQDVEDVKIGSNSLENVLEAFNKLATDLQVKPAQDVEDDVALPKT